MRLAMDGELCDCECAVSQGSRREPYGELNKSKVLKCLT